MKKNLLTSSALLAAISLVLLLRVDVYAQTQAETSYLNFSSGENEYLFSVSPNPCEDFINLNIHPGNKNIRSIKIFDLIGKEVASVELTQKAGTSIFRVDFSMLKPGVYFCNVYSDKGIVETVKILRTRH